MQSVVPIHTYVAVTAVVMLLQNVMLVVANATPRRAVLMLRNTNSNLTPSLPQTPCRR